MVLKKCLRKRLGVVLLLLISIFGFSQEKKKTKKTSENFEMLSELYKLHPEYDMNKDDILSEGEYRSHQLNRDYRKYDKPFKGYYNYLSDLYYADNTNKAQSLDVMMPLNRKSEKLPAVVFIHGGGWKNGDKSIGLGVLDPFISSGEYIGVTVNYRLSREAIWPAQIQDCKAAIRWIKANADKYGIDKHKIVVWGFSAGGHLSAMMAVSTNHKEFEGSLGSHLDMSSEVTCSIFGAGPTDFLMKKSVSVIPQLVDNGFRGSSYNVFNLLDDGSAIKEKARKASPIYLIDNKTKPVFIYHGMADPLVNMEHSDSFINTCKEKGATDYYITKVDGLKHEAKMPTALREKITSFLQKYLQNKKVELVSSTVVID